VDISLHGQYRSYRAAGLAFRASYYNKRAMPSRSRGGVGITSVVRVNDNAKGKTNGGFALAVLMRMLIAFMIATAVLDICLAHHRILRSTSTSSTTTSSSAGSSETTNRATAVEAVNSIGPGAGTTPATMFESALTAYYRDAFNVVDHQERSDRSNTISDNVTAKAVDAAVDGSGTTDTTTTQNATSPSALSSLWKSLQRERQQSGSENRKVRIAVFPVVKGSPKKRKANYRHLIEDGVQQSPHLEFVKAQEGGGEQELVEKSIEIESSTAHADGIAATVATTTPTVWLLDHLAARDAWGKQWCYEFRSLLETAVELRRLAGLLSLQWPVVIIDNRDYAYISYCPYIEQIVGPENVRYSFRSLVTKRAWSKSKPWVRTGKLIDVKSQAPQAQYEHRHRPIGVRTDTVKAVHEYLLQRGGDDRYDSTAQKLCHDIEGGLDRPIDVSYFWESHNYTRDDSYLRDKVYDVLSDFRKLHMVSEKHREQGESSINQYRIDIGMKGNAQVWGRKSVSPSYVEALLESKIVIVAQRDYWEDHYRLFEAMVAGAMVMTDRMLSLPPGLKDGVSVVEYASAEDLIDKLEYYLNNDSLRIEVARAGRHVAMSRHRSWHHMEEIVFGRPVTVCATTDGDDGSTNNSRCPHMVNAKNMNEPC